MENKKLEIGPVGYATIIVILMMWTLAIVLMCEPEVQLVAIIIISIIVGGFSHRTLKQMQVYKNQTYKDICTDSETGLYNKSYFNDILRHTVERSLRNDRDGVIVLFKINGMEDISTKGRRAVIETICNTLAPKVRQSDTFARLGDNLFAILAYDTDVDDIMHIGERIRIIANSACCSVCDRDPGDFSATIVIKKYDRELYIDAPMYLSAVMADLDNTEEKNTIIT